ncbi:MAG: hypothetical protein L6R43_06620 [Planctomycetes bacterium]|nr:hypothetical protein [Planctomycetota bacterium]
MGKVLGRLKIGGCALSWERERATLADAAGTREITLRPPAGGLGEKPLAKDPDQAILGLGNHVVLADGSAFTLAGVDHGKAVLAAWILGDRAVLASRERVAVHAFDGARLGGAESPGGGLRPELAAVSPRALALPFHDAFLVVRADGLCAPHAVKAGFPLLRRVGGWFLAGGGDLLVLASVEEPGRADAGATEGNVRHELAAVRGTLAAVPARSDVYIVDGEEGRILGRPVEGRILSLEVGAETVTVQSAGNRTTIFDRRGNRV